MATKPQAKAAIDSGAIFFKNDIDSILPTGVNIVEGNLHFNPNRGDLHMEAPDEATALSWASTISANLTTAGRTHQISHTGRRAREGEAQRRIMVQSALIVYHIRVA